MHHCTFHRPVVVTDNKKFHDKMLSLAKELHLTQLLQWNVRDSTIEELFPQWNSAVLRGIRGHCWTRRVIRCRNWLATIFWPSHFAPKGLPSVRISVGNSFERSPFFLHHSDLFLRWWVAFFIRTLSLHHFELLAMLFQNSVTFFNPGGEL